MSSSSDSAKFALAVRSEVLRSGPHMMCFSRGGRMTKLEGPHPERGTKDHELASALCQMAGGHGISRVTKEGSKLVVELSYESPCGSTRDAVWKAICRTYG